MGQSFDIDILFPMFAIFWKKNYNLLLGSGSKLCVVVIYSVGPLVGMRSNSLACVKWKWNISMKCDFTLNFDVVLYSLSRFMLRIISFLHFLIVVTQYITLERWSPHTVTDKVGVANSFVISYRRGHEKPGSVFIPYDFTIVHRYKLVFVPQRDSAGI